MAQWLEGKRMTKVKMTVIVTKTGGGEGEWDDDDSSDKDWDEDSDSSGWSEDDRPVDGEDDTGSEWEEEASDRFSWIAHVSTIPSDRVTRGAKRAEQAALALATSMPSAASDDDAVRLDTTPGGPPSFSIARKSHHNYLFAGESIESLRPLKAPESEHPSAQIKRESTHFRKRKDLLGAGNGARTSCVPDTGKDKSGGERVKLLLKMGGNSAVQQQYLDMFLAHIKHPDVFEDQLQERARVLMSIKSHLNGCLLSVSDEKLAELEGTVLIEDNSMAKELFKRGLKVENVENYYRIHAPEPDANGKIKPFAFYFWRKDGPHDNTPTDDKVFGALIYNPGAYRRATDQQELVKEAIDYAILKRGNLERRATAGGKMANMSIGLQANRGALTVTPVADADLKAKLMQYSPIIDAEKWALLQAFLPGPADKMRNICKEYNLLNSYGIPTKSSWASFAYAAYSHKDKADRTISSGLVSLRPPDMPRNEANFVYVRYRLVIEGITGMRWWWQAGEDLHGTTWNNVMVREMQTQGRFSWVRLAGTSPNAGQWTTVDVVTKRLMTAATNYTAPH
ncbi:hypothetical protein BOTBODRAFT_47431 [Botryobasidium botryosum FD-172 SS1]|uniref:Uncharacterized protein n=1 Tax=Botryobasidium botryosum (strain FD-172 SS1) TaxID=930990 RepID=A0A067MDD0_BOTB1|nr:hypothetical protein BOTBODRAFT_47431 [Botryobasidium botryosum FD-172 SS1]